MAPKGAQRKIPVDLHFLPPAQSVLREPFGVARAVCFEELAGVFASSGAMHYAKFAVSRKNRPVLPGQRANILLNCPNDAATRKKQLVLPRQRRNFPNDYLR